MTKKLKPPPNLMFFSDDGTEPQRVDCVLEYTPALVADEVATKMIGDDVREALAQGKTVLVRVVESGH